MIRRPPRSTRTATRLPYTTLFRALVRGAEVVDTGEPIMMPVGPECLGRILNVIGEPVDERGPVNAKVKSPIHKDAPEFVRSEERRGGKECVSTCRSRR